MTDSPASVPVAPGSPTLRLRERIRYNLALLDLRGRGFVLIGGLLLLAWLSSGIYKVQPDEQGIVLRFGRWQQTAESGLHYHLPYPIETVLLPRITQVNQLQLGSGASGLEHFLGQELERRHLTMKQLQRSLHQGQEPHP